jgi:putative NADH-flavin reductase
MKITVFGAAGKTGRPLVEQALALGYEVTAFVRKTTININHKNLKIIQGDVTDPDAVTCAVHGSDAVISVLNSSINPENKPLTLGTNNILAAMEKYGVRRLIMSSAGLTENDPGDLPNLRYDMIVGLMGFIGKLIMRSSYDDHVDAVKAARESGVDWTIVRMVSPTNKPLTGKVNAGFVNKTTRLRISRSNAATFMLNELQKGEYVRRVPVVFD